MANVVDIIYKQEFTATNIIVVNHGQNLNTLGVQVVVEGKCRPDLVTSIIPSAVDPTNSFTLTLNVSTSGLIQIYQFNLLAVNIPSATIKAVLENSGFSSADTIPKTSELEHVTAPLDAVVGSGVISGADLSPTGGIGFSVSPGSAVIKDDGVVYFPEWVTSLTGTTSYGGDNYIAIDKNGAIVVTSSFPNGNLAKVGYVRTDPTNSVVLGFSDTKNVIESFETMVHTFARLGIGTLAEKGCIVAEKADPDFLELDITSGKFFIQLNEITVGDTSSFTKFYKTSGQDWVIDSNNPNHVNTTQWNDATQPQGSALVTMTDGYWKKDVLVRTSTGAVYYAFGQAEYATEEDALKGALPVLPDALINGGVVYLAYIASQKGDTSIANRLHDIRPILSRIFGYGTAGSVGATMVHANLLGLGADDHILYHTDARANIWLGTKTTDNLLEGANLYYTEGRVSANDSVVENTAHREDTNNPHLVNKVQINLGNVTDDAQLKRLAADFDSFSEKTNPTDNDLLLLEDSIEGLSKKKIRIANLPGGGGGIFGSELQYVELVSGFGTTSTSFVPVISINTPVTLPAGTYRISWNYEWTHSSTQTKFRARVRLDDTDPNLMDQQEETVEAGNDNYAPTSGFVHKYLTAGEHEIVFAIASSNPSQQSVVWNSRLEIWRIN